MQFSFLRDLISTPWQVDMLTAQMYAPVLRGVFAGLHFEREEPSEQHKPFQVTLTHQPKAKEGTESVFVQPVRGVMMRNDTSSGSIGTKTMAKNLLNADKNPTIIGHILLIDSGGGQASAVPELADAIKKLTKPIIAWVDGTMCSAAMYAGSYCREIIASRDTDNIGCIGTMIEFGGFPKFNKEPDGFTTVRLYADGADEKNEEFETAIGGDFKLVKERILNPHNEQFKADIRANRPNVKDEHLKGRTFRASEVVGTLIDSIGPMESAVARVVELSQTTRKPNNSKMSNKFPALMAVLAVTELVIEEGHTSLSEEQLTVIENALANAAGLQGQLDTANATIAERDTTVNTQTARIAELEKGAGAAPATVVKKTDGNEGDEPVNTYQEVRNTLKGEK